MDNYQMRRSNGGHLLHIVQIAHETSRFSRTSALCGYAPSGGRRAHWVSASPVDLERFKNGYCPKCVAKYREKQ